MYVIFNKPLVNHATNLGFLYLLMNVVLQALDCDNDYYCDLKEFLVVNTFFIELKNAVYIKII